jgi:N-acetylglucosamine-6-phosphate deacetylase
MLALTARAPGLAGTALADGRVTVQVIADGVHCADDMLQLVATAAARGWWNLVSDATAASGLGDREFLFGEVARRHPPLRRHGPRAWRGSRGRERAPAALVGREHLGRIPLGGLADLVVLGEDLEVGDVNIEGRLLI